MISESYYFCPDCKKFHEYGTEKVVSRKLCFICGNLKTKKTNILRFIDNTSTQVCDTCMNENEDIKKAVKYLKSSKK